MSIVGETVLTVIMEMLFKKMASEVLPLFGRQEKIRSDLEDWQRKLKKIKAVLHDADEKQMTNESVRIWLCELQDLAYDVEDILEEFAAEALKRNLLHQPHEPSTGKFRKLIPTCCTNFSPSSIRFDSKMSRKIDEITDRLQKITTEKNQLELNEISAGRSKKVEQRLPTTSLVNEAKVYGRKKEKKEIIELLLRDDLISDEGVSVIPILAMGGMGKTTLAQLVYNDKAVESYFEFKAWVCISEDFDVIKVTKSILNSIDGKAGDVDDLNKLQEKLKSKLLKRKFFLVLDDLWNENPEDWERLSLPFGAGTQESKIIVTTRIKDVASIVGTVPPYELKKLSDDDCLRLFTRHSLGKGDFSTHLHLKEIGENIVEKCDGLPLAAKTLGSLLRNKDDRNDWLKVQNSRIWELPEEKCGVMKALRVSYHYLPAHLKQCFIYCSLLPKDYEFDEQEVILLWMGEGLLQPDTNGKKMEESGHDYFQELQSRSFFQRSSVDVSKFAMHDLINDLAQWAAGGIHFRTEDSMSESNKQPKDSKTLRHLSYTIDKWDGTKRLETISVAEYLRTFLPMKGTDGRKYLSYNVVDELLKRQHLRVLSLRGYCISKISNIQNLIHLCHLDLSETSIITLPESVITLYNLQTLLLENCCQLKTLCADMGNLIKLRHLNNSNAFSLEKMPLGISKLTCLQTLCYFVVGKNVGSQLRDLNSLKNLRGNLKIAGLENVQDVGGDMEVELNDKENLHELFLEWSNSNGSSRDLDAETRVLDMLRPFKNLKQLAIKGYSGRRFPTWLGDSTFSNLVLLHFEDCDACTSLPTIGQLPVLKDLSIIGMARVKRVGSEFYGGNGSVSFPSLATLKFENLQEWEEWIPPNQEVEVFPQLRDLFLVKCSKLLGRLPEHFPLLERLVIEDCGQLLVSIPTISTLCKLEINGCRKVVWKRTIDPCSSNSRVLSEPELVFPTGPLKQELPNLKDLSIRNTKEATCLWRTGTELLQDISSLHRMNVSSCPEFVSLLAEEEDEQEQRGLQCRLHHLELSNYQSLVKLSIQALLSLSSLKRIEISDCDSLESLPEAWMHNTNISLESLDICRCHSLTCIAKVQLPSSLKRMHINDCKSLRSLIDDDQISAEEAEEDINSGCSRYTSVLEELDIGYCPSLTSLWSKIELPATIERVCIFNCSKLVFLSSRGNLPKALRELWIYECPELESIAEGLDNNSSLESIFITNCQNLRFLPNSLHNACQLRKITLSGCRKLVSFPGGGLQGCKKLTEFLINRCENLKTLPSGMNSLPSLQYLRIGDCPSIDLCSPTDEAIFPTNISSLEICYIKIYKPLYEWRLHRFTSITKLELDGHCSDHLVSFPPEENTKVVLPASLRSLSIISFQNLERLHSVFENVTSLKSLCLFGCRKLEYISVNRLPPSLLKFEIYGCPLLCPKFLENEGQYWPLIAHVPYVHLYY